MNRTREKILTIAMETLKKNNGINNFTVRKIAHEAGVNLALISYYFGSRENLLYEAATNCLEEISAKMLSSQECNIGKNPTERLIIGLIDLGDFLFNNRNLAEISVMNEISQGNNGVVSFVLPTLKEIFKNSKNETEIRLIALQFIIPLQVLFLYPEEYRNNHNLDISKKINRDKIVTEIIMNCLKNKN